MKRRLGASLRLVGTLAVLAAASAASAEGAGTLRVVNKTAGYITVNVDGNYGCHTSAGSTCSIPVTQGAHHLKAVRTDTDPSRTVETDVNIGAEPYEWTPWES